MVKKAWAAMACLLGTASLADGIAYYQTFTDVDYKSVAVGGMRTWAQKVDGVWVQPANATLTLSGIPSGSTIVKALLYWHGDADGSEVVEAPATSVSVNGTSVSGAAVATPTNPALSISGGNAHEKGGNLDGNGYLAGSLSQTFIADVTALVSGDGAYAVSAFQPASITINGASLLVIYRDSDPGNNVDVTIYHGNDSTGSSTAGTVGARGWNIGLGSIVRSPAASLTLELHVSDGQMFADNPLKLNGQVVTMGTFLGYEFPDDPEFKGDALYSVFSGEAPIANPNFDLVSWEGSMWDRSVFDITALVPAGVATPLQLGTPFRFDEYSLVAAVLIAPHGSYAPPPPPDPLNHPPTVSCQGDVKGQVLQSLATGKDVTLTATVTDLEGDPVTVSWWVTDAIGNRTLEFVQTVPSGGTSVFAHRYAGVAGAAAANFLVNPVVSGSSSIGEDSCSIAVELIGDRTPPTVTLSLTSITLPAGTTTMPDLAPYVTAVDFTDAGTPTPAGDLTISQSPATGATLPVGDTTATVTVTDAAGNATSASVVVTVQPTVPGACSLYPIALHVNTLRNVLPGAIVQDVYSGIGSGNFGWLTWAGSPNEPTLAKSLTVPGDSDTYINPKNTADHCVSVGDWVQGSPGISNSSDVRAKLDILKNYDITIPVYDVATGTGNNSLYHVVNFAMIRITDYRLPNENRISAKFLGYVDCGCPAAPVPPPAPASCQEREDSDRDRSGADREKKAEQVDERNRAGGSCNTASPSRPRK